MHLSHMHDCGESERACKNCDYSRTLRRLGYIWNRCLAEKLFRVLIPASTDADADDAAMMQLSSPEQQRSQAEAARKQSFAQSREESSRLACERDVARAKQRGSHVFPVATAEALCARLVRRPC